MSTISQLWQRFEPLSILDILLVALLVYWLLGVIRGTRAVPLLRGITILIALALLGSSFQSLRTLQWLMANMVRPALFVAIPVLFQPELRRALESLGRT